MARTVSIVGSTGSIGTQAIDVLKAISQDFRVLALGVRSSVEKLVEQVNELRPEMVAVSDSEAAARVRQRVPAEVEVLAGEDSLKEIAREADVVLNALVGFDGLAVSIAALEAGKRLALANKESLVVGASLMKEALRRGGGELLPVDSEHVAIHQCIDGWSSSVSRLIITASGGPFRDTDIADLGRISPEDALAHPTWKMGPKITVDSSTLMNKGLEVIEAHELFDISYQQIDVLIHPQSIVHSMVEFTDGATLAQLSMPDMRLPIGYALSYPERMRVPYGRINWSELTNLEFRSPDRERFPCLDLALQAGQAGGVAPAWLNAANEVAVQSFLDHRISWVEIAEVVADTLAVCDFSRPSSFEDLVIADHEARRVALLLVENKQQG